MIYEPIYIRELLTKLVDETISSAEMETIFVLLDIYTEEEIEKMMDGIEPGIDFKEYNYGEWESPPFHELKDRMGINTTRNRRKKIKQFAYYAAMWLSLAVFIVISILFFLGPQLRYSCGGSAGEAEIPTGVYSCRLTLANGCSILIDSSYHGLIMSEDNIEIVRLETGELLYRKIGSGSKKDEGDTEYNIITTAPGAQYKIILSNGSKIRLNAASSIRFPMDFTEQNHVIELKGEAFFEIPPNLIYPLIAKAGNTLFRVSGTTFNVNSYFNNTVATLINGSLEITNDRDHFLLKPGEQAIIKNTKDKSGLPDTIIKLSPSDTAQIVSWRKTLHQYTKMEFKDFVADIGRWYGLDIISIESVPKGYFSGSFCYDIPLEEVLEIFRRMGMHFRREGSKIIFTGNA